MKRLGYYAKDKNNNLFQFEWGADDGSQTNEDFFIIRNGEKRKSIATDYEILEIGFFTADSPSDDQLKPFDRQIYNIILVHVARTWERIRVTQKHKEMPLDNIESADDAIPYIADIIYEGKIIQGFLNGNEDDYWENNTKEGMSDSFIEAEAERFINKNYLGIEVYDTIPYSPIYEAEDLDPKDIIGVSPIEYVVNGCNFEELSEAWFYWVQLKEKDRVDGDIEVFARVWVSLSDEAIERQERPEGSVECNVTKIDFVNNDRSKDSIAFELWEWIKDTVSPTTDLLPFELSWNDAVKFNDSDEFKDQAEIKHPKYNVTFAEIMNDIIDIDQVEIGGRGFIEFNENVAKQNVEWVLSMMDKYRDAKLV